MPSGQIYVQPTLARAIRCGLRILASLASFADQISVAARQATRENMRLVARNKKTQQKANGQQPT